MGAPGSEPGPSLAQEVGCPPSLDTGSHLHEPKGPLRTALWSPVNVCTHHTGHTCVGTRIHLAPKHRSHHTCDTCAHRMCTRHTQVHANAHTHVHAMTHMHIACHTCVHVSRTEHMHANESTHMHTSHTGTHTTHTCTRPVCCLRLLSLFTPLACSGLRLDRRGLSLLCDPRAKGGRAPGFQRQLKAPLGGPGWEVDRAGHMEKDKTIRKKQFYFQSKNVLQTVSGFKNVKSNKRLQPTVKIQSETVNR